MTAIPVSAVILAGGLGTRLKSTVPDVPKPMAPINGRPFLEHLMDYWIAQGVRHFVLSVGYLHEVITSHFGTSYNGAQVEYVIEKTPLGTGGGLLLATALLDKEKPFLVLNGDTYFAVELPQLVTFFNTQDADWAFSLFRSTDTARYMAMDIAENGKISALKAHSAQSIPLANGGVYLVHPRALGSLYPAAGAALSLESDMFPAALAAGQHLFGLEFTGTFIDIGVPDDYYRAGDVI